MSTTALVIGIAFWTAIRSGEGMGSFNYSKLHYYCNYLCKYKDFISQNIEL